MVKEGGRNSLILGMLAFNEASKSSNMAESFPGSGLMFNATINTVVKIIRSTTSFLKNSNYIA